MKQQRGINTKLRFSAVSQVLFGFALMVFGIADNIEHKDFQSGFPSESALGIWMGLLVSKT